MSHKLNQHCYTNKGELICKQAPSNIQVCSDNNDCTDCTDADCFWQPSGIEGEQCFSECMIADLSCYGTTDRWEAECPEAYLGTYSGYLRPIEASFCMDACSNYHLESETGKYITNIKFNENNDPSLYLNRFVEIEGNEVWCVECGAIEVEDIHMSYACENPVQCLVDPCEVAPECQLNQTANCESNYCGGCYADFYDLDGNLVDCYSPIIEECDDVGDVFFGPCDMYMGVAIVNGECEHVSGCDWEVDGVDYYDAFFGTIDECNTNCINQPYLCEDIQYDYDQLHSGVYATCEFDNDCVSVWGDCDVGLGGCHYAVNQDSYPEQQINDLVDLWLETKCTSGVCDCAAEPYAQCIDNTCTPAYCMSDNPAGCFQTGCDEGYECVVQENECTPSWCGCDGFYGEWFCTEDCGGGSCVAIMLAGDINFDSLVNVVDIVLLVNFIIENNTPTTDQFNAADYNTDGILNVIDVVGIVNMIIAPETSLNDHSDDGAF